MLYLCYRDLFHQVVPLFFLFFFFKINSSVELTWPCLIKSFFCSLTLPDFSGGGYHGYDESYGSPPYEGRRMGPPMRGRGGRSYGPGYGPPPPPPGEYGGHAESPVVMLYGLDPLKMNADRVFNIFCLYGNVERVSI